MKSVKKERMCEELYWRKTVVHVQQTCWLAIQGGRIVRGVLGNLSSSGE